MFFSQIEKGNNNTYTADDRKPVSTIDKKLQPGDRTHPKILIEQDRHTP